MTKKQRSIRHHTVPKFYLAGFANERDQVMRVALPGEHRHIESITNATVVNDFYTLNKDGEPSDDFERLLADLEGDAATAFRIVLQDRQWPVDEETRFVLASWAAIQFLRTPTVRQHYDDIANLTARLEIGAGGKRLLRERMEYDLSRAVTDAELDETWDRHTRPEGPGIETGALTHVSNMLDLALDVGESFYNRSWMLARFQRRTLTTSDNPVALAPDLHHPNQGTGVHNAMHILVPMNRNTLLIMGPPGPDMLYPASTNVAKYANSMVAWYASRALFHHPDDSPLNGIELPQPGRPRVTANIDRFIREEGLFAPEASLPGPHGKKSSAQ